MHNHPKENKQINGFDKNPYIQQPQNRQQPEPVMQNQNPYYTPEAIAQNTQIPQRTGSVDSLFGSFDTQNFLKGALIGAIGAYLLTNENAQKTIFKTIAKGADMFGAGMEEMKERMEDAKAELEAEREAKA